MSAELNAAHFNTRRDAALVGAGYWGKNLARVLHRAGRLGVICDASRELLASYEDEYPGIVKTPDVAAVMADAGIDKVVIAAPASLHYELAKAALLEGKDVFVEKPLCLVPEEGKELVAIATRMNRILMVGHLLHYHPCVEAVIAMVNAGELGRLQYLTSTRLNLGKIRSEEDVLWSFAPHDISVILRVAGDQLPSEVRCMGGDYLRPGISDVSVTRLTFADGLGAHVWVSWLNPFKEQKLTVIGSKGAAVFDDTRPWGEKLAVFRDSIKWSSDGTPAIGNRNGEYIAVSNEEPLWRECEHFLRSCETRAVPRTDGTEGLRVLRVLAAASESLKRGGEVATP